MSLFSRKNIFVKCMAIMISFVFIFVRSENAKAVLFNYYPCFCHSCTNSFDQSYLDSNGRPRQYGIKLCGTHLSEKSNAATFYKRGYADYNCLAYALKNNSPNAWYWPEHWGSQPSLSVVGMTLANNGYSYIFPANDFSHAGGDVIFIYGTSQNCVTHFARRTNLSGNYVSGAATISKFGVGSLYTTSNTNPFKGDYGQLLGVAAQYYYNTK